MKKLIPLLLAILLLAGCASPGGAPTSPDAPTAPTTAPTTAATTVPTTTAAKSTSITRGSWDGNDYTNDSIGLALTMPEGWISTSDEDMAVIAGIGAELMAESGMDITETMENISTIYDMMIQNPSTGTNAFIMLESLEVSYGGSTVDVSMLSESFFLEAMGQQLTALDNIGYTIDGDIFKQDISGNTFYVLGVNAESFGLRQLYCVRKLDSYMICIVFTMTGADTDESMFALFN